MLDNYHGPLNFILVPVYEHLGCFKDSIPRAIDSLEGNSKVTSILIGHYKTRIDAIEKCYLAAKQLWYNVFALQDGGQCFSSAIAMFTHDRYGTSSDCAIDKKGGPMANDVYIINLCKSKIPRFTNQVTSN